MANIEIIMRIIQGTNLWRHPFQQVYISVGKHIGYADWSKGLYRDCWFNDPCLPFPELCGKILGLV